MDASTETAAWAHDEFLHGYWVEPGRILAGEYPGDLDRTLAIRKVGLLVDNGIRTLVDLTEPVDGLEPYDDVLADIRARDTRDSERAAAPLIQAPDAIRLDTTTLDRDAAIAEALRIAGERLG